MPPTPASPAPRTTPVFIDEIGLCVLVLARDQSPESKCKTSGTQETAHTHEALVRRVGEQEGGKED